MVVLLLSACSSRHEARPSGLGPTVAATGVVLPGGPRAQPPAGSPPVCFALAQSVAIRGIGEAMGQLAVDDTAATGARGLRDAAADLRALAGESDSALRSSVLAAADAISHLADVGVGDASAVDAASQALA